jgi:hypothetical protein
MWMCATRRLIISVEYPEVPSASLLPMWIEPGTCVCRCRPVTRWEVGSSGCAIFDVAPWRTVALPIELDALRSMVRVDVVARDQFHEVADFARFRAFFTDEEWPVAEAWLVSGELEEGLADLLAIARNQAAALRKLWPGGSSTFMPMQETVAAICNAANTDDATAFNALVTRLQRAACCGARDILQRSLANLEHVPAMTPDEERSQAKWTRKLKRAIDAMA